MGIPPYEIQLLNNLQGQFQDMLHRSFHHSITSRNFEDIPQRVVTDADATPTEEGGVGKVLPTADEKVESAASCLVGNGRRGSTTTHGDEPNDDAMEMAASSPSSSARPQPEARHCTICLMTPVVNDVLKTLPCDHFFHSDCLKQWFTDHASCPMCRDCALCRISGAFNVQFSPS